MSVENPLKNNPEHYEYFNLERYIITESRKYIDEEEKNNKKKEFNQEKNEKKYLDKKKMKKEKKGCCSWNKAYLIIMIF